MIQYSTSDILKKASQLADLENSDFISYSEKLTLLNDAYSKVYQTAINAGDLMYIKKISLSDTSVSGGDDERYIEYQLPKDFYQLYSVKACSTGRFTYPLARHVKDGHDTAASYEIKNDKLIIYSPTISRVEVEYYPIPSTLFVKRENLDLDTFSGFIKAYYKDMLLIYSPDTFTLSAYSLTESQNLMSWSLVTDQEKAGNPEVNISRVFAGYNGVVVKYSVKWTEIKVVKEGEEEKTIEIPHDDYKTFKSDFDEAGVIKPEDPGEIVVRQDDGIYLDKPADGTLRSMLLTEDEVYEVHNAPEGDTFNGALLPKGHNVIDLLEDGKLFITSDEGITSIFDASTKELINTVGNKMEKIICVGDNSLSTGYGALSKKAGRKPVIRSLFNDTLLDYPNNLYFTMISYMLAISYKIKQNADIAPLSTAYDEAVDQYYDMLKRDGNAPVRINNVYR